MKKKSAKFIVVLLVLAAAAAVVYFFAMDGKEAPSKSPIEFVNGIMDGSGTHEHELLGKYDSSDRSGAIYIIGTEEEADYLAGAFLDCDYFDNIDGRGKPDFLKDFSGETICPVYNYFDFDGLNASGDDGALREIAVRAVLAAMDTVCFVSPYDRKGLGRKPLANLIVLANPYSSEKGQYDVDTLFSYFNCKVPVLNFVDLVVENSLAGAPRGAFNVGVIDKWNGSAYAGRFAALSAGAGSGTVVNCFQPGTLPEGNTIVNFLDRYVQDGHSAKLDALIVNDPSLDVPALRDTLAGMTSAMNASSLSYGRLIADDIRVVDAREVLAKSVYRFLRRNNLFTHKVALPSRIDFMVLPKEEGSVELRLMQYSKQYIDKN